MLLVSFLRHSDEQKLTSSVEAKSVDSVDKATVATVPNLDTTKVDELKKMNNLLKDLGADSTAEVKTSTTTTSITVNITKQTTEKSNDGTKSDEIVTSITEAAAVAVNAAVDKLDVTEKKNDVVNDVEMEDLSADVEMIEAPTTEKSSSEATSASIVADESIASTTKNDGEKPTEQKIDDVEKNISNLFNGEESAKSTKNGVSEATSGNNTTTAAEQSKIENGAKNSSEVLAIASATIDEKNSTVSVNNVRDIPKVDNSDLVSILTDDDKPQRENVDKVSSSSSTAIGTVASVENKILSSIKKTVTSTPSSSSTQTVFNSTPIQKQFDISSENVSTIDADIGLGDKSTHQEIISSHSSTAPDATTGKQ